MGLVGEDGKPVKSEQPGAPPNAGDANVPQEPPTPEQFEQMRVDAIAEFLADYSAASSIGTLNEQTQKDLAKHIVAKAAELDPVLRPVTGPRAEIELRDDGSLSIIGHRDPNVMKRLLLAALEEVQFSVFKARMLKVLSQPKVATPGLREVLNFGKKPFGKG